MYVYLLGDTIRQRPDEKVTEEVLLHWRTQGIRHIKVSKIPSIKRLEAWSNNGICPTPDGCRVEPDGHCPHGWPSWLLILGYI